MKIKILFTFILFFIISNVCWGQSIGIGLRDNQYIHLDYMGKINNPKNNWIIGYEQSLLNVKIKEQNGRLYAGYLFTNNLITLATILYGNSEYTNKWNSIGGNIKGIYNYRFLKVTATLNPNYDSDLKFQFNYDFGVYLRIYKAKTLTDQSLFITTSYGNIPEYRQNNKKICLGLEFVNGNLWVKPLICIPNIFNDQIEKHIRVLCNLGWRFNFNKK